MRRATRGVRFQARQLALLVHHLGVGAHDLGGLAVERERNDVGDLRPLGGGFLDAAHDELEVRDVILFALVDHQEFLLIDCLAVQSVAAIEHEYLERGHA